MSEVVTTLGRFLFHSHMGAFGVWQSKPEGGEWQEYPTHIAKALEDAFSLGKNEACFVLTQQNIGLRADDVAKQFSQLNYKVDFSTMTQLCIEAPARKREVRRCAQDVALSPSQTAAIAHAEDLAHHNCGPALTALRARMIRLAGDENAFDELNRWMRHSVPIIIHTKLSGILIDKYSDDTHYRCFHETGTGRGSTSTDDRGSWEARVFGKAYQHVATAFDMAFDKTPAFELPKYGCLNLTNDPKGVRSATQYGTSFFVLKDAVRWRCTITSMDSCYKQARPGTFRQFARFFEEGDESRLTDDDLLKVYRHRGEQMAINKYKEVQIHGPLRFRHDVEMLVADSSLTPADQTKVRAFAQKNGFPVKFQAMHHVEAFKCYKGGNV